MKRLPLTGGRDLFLHLDRFDTYWAAARNFGGIKSMIGAVGVRTGPTHPTPQHRKGQPSESDPPSCNRSFTM